MYATVDGYEGIVWYVRGNAKRWTEESWEHIEGTDPNNEGNYYYNEPEEVEDEDRLIAIMVGDDREFTFDKSEVHEYHGEVCSCGQLGCGWG